MDTWVLQMGFPVVTVDTVPGVFSEQKHFLLDPDSDVDRPSEFGYIWKVPISYLKSNGQNGTWWLTGQRDRNDAFMVSETDWILVNLDVTGYYRVNYDNKNWNNLLNQLN
ncbi:unnamed protein product, partial [Staurois parvus]